MPAIAKTVRVLSEIGPDAMTCTERHGTMVRRSNRCSEQPRRRVRRQHGAGLRAGALEAANLVIADGVPDASAIDQAADETPLAARRQDPDTEAPEVPVWDVTGLSVRIDGIGAMQRE